MKVPWLLVFCEIFLLTVIAIYFGSFPIFPEIRSADFAQHISQSRDLAHGLIPPLSGQLLYYAVEWYLAFFQFIFPSANPFFIVRWAMAFLVFLSPLAVYAASKEVFQKDWSAKITTILYSLTGFIWFDMVFVSGLYANFVGILASLFLMTTVLRHIRSPSKKGLALTAIALGFAAFSHYSTLLIFPPLVSFALWKKDWHVSALLITPMVAGLGLFPGLVSGLLGFLAPTPNIISQPTALSPFLILPSLQFLAEEITDAEFIFLMLGVVLGSWFAWKTKDERMVFLLFWFILPLAVAPMNSSAWRFSFISLLPGTMLLGYSLSKVARYPVKHGLRGYKSEASNPKLLLLAALLLVPSFYPSWSYQALDHAIASGNPSDQQVYSALRWIGNNLTVNPVCANEPQANLHRCDHMVSLTDWRFGYSPLFGGPAVLYGPDYGAIVTDPFQATLFASTHNSTFLIITRQTTILQPPCDPRGSFGLTLTVNSTQVRPNDPVKVGISSIRGLNVTLHFYDNASFYPVNLVDGSRSLVLAFPKAGLNTLKLTLGPYVQTTDLKVVVGSTTTYSPASASVPPDYCHPYRVFNQTSLPGWTLAFKNEDVFIWKAP